MAQIMVVSAPFPITDLLADFVSRRRSLADGFQVAPRSMRCA